MVIKNKISNPFFAGIFILGSGGTYEKNKIKASQGDGVRIAGSGNTLTKNKVSKSTDTGLKSDVPESENTYENNKFDSQEFPPEE